MINQVNTVLLRRNLLRHVFRQYHNEPEPSNILYPLESRKVLKVAGAEAAAFLQGLVTNDMRHLEDGANSMYAMFLNNKGRVLYDTLIHKYKDGFMIECDKSILSLLKRHLQLYKLKRKVDIEDISHNFKLFAFVAPPSKWLSSDVGYNINIYKDPRLPDLGYRILTGVAMKTETVVDLIGNDVIIEKNEKGYNLLRYKLGVSEGALDLPPGSSFPLEANCDYLHGVSFHKGCYIGQELTARVHHTGVIRKRIMPLKFCENVANLELGSVISASNNPKSNIGKLRGFMGTCGIGLVRIKEAMEAQEFNIAEYTVKINKPAWWPIEAPKEKATVAKSEINLE